MPDYAIFKKDGSISGLSLTPDATKLAEVNSDLVKSVFCGVLSLTDLFAVKREDGSHVVTTNIGDAVDTSAKQVFLPESNSPSPLCMISLFKSSGKINFEILRECTRSETKYGKLPFTLMAGPSFVLGECELDIDELIETGVSQVDAGFPLTDDVCLLIPEFLHLTTRLVDRDTRASGSTRVLTSSQVDNPDLVVKKVTDSVFSFILRKNIFLSGTVPLLLTARDDFSIAYSEVEFNLDELSRYGELHLRLEDVPPEFGIMTTPFVDSISIVYD